MEFEKQLLKMPQKKGSAFTQMTLEDDFIIPDVKPDVLKVIHTKGVLEFDVPKVSNHSVWVNGRMHFTVLYRSEDTQWKVDAASGSIPFQEKLSMDDVDETDEVRLKGNIEDISASLINSRKIAIRALVDVEAGAENVRWEEVVTGIRESGRDGADGSEQEDAPVWEPRKKQGHTDGAMEREGSGNGNAGAAAEFEYKSSERELLGLKFTQKDLLRIRKDLPIGQGMPNILDLVYYDVTFMGLHATARDHAIEVAGEAGVCAFYRGQGEEELSVFSAVVPLEETVDSRELTAADICWIDVEPEETELEIQEDYDGEQRVLALECAVGITMHAWEEQSIPVLEDVYSPGCELVVQSQPASCERLLIENQTKVRLAEQLVLEAGQERMLSISCAEGKMVIEHIAQTEAGLLVTGMLTVHLLYLSNDDFQPIGSARGFLPLGQLIEIPQAQGRIRYELRPGVEQLAVSLMDSSTYEVKAAVTLEAIVFEEVVFDKLVDVEQRPLDMDALQNQPGLVGHKVRQGEDLWSIAKKYHTTESRIMEINHFTDKNIKPGQKIVVVKEIL